MEQLWGITPILLPAPLGAGGQQGKARRGQRCRVCLSWNCRGCHHVLPWGCWQWGAPSNLHARHPPQAQCLHQIITEPALERPPHCGERRAWHWQHWVPESPCTGGLPRQRQGNGVQWHGLVSGYILSGGLSMAGHGWPMGKEPDRTWEQGHRGQGMRTEHRDMEMEQKRETGTEMRGSMGIGQSLGREMRQGAWQQRQRDGKG